MSLGSLERISWLVKELNLVSNCAGQLSHPHLIIAMIYRFIFTLIKIHGASETYVGFQGSFGSGKSLPSLSNCLDKTNNPMSGCQSKSHEHKCRIMKPFKGSLIITTQPFPPFLPFFSAITSLQQLDSYGSCAQKTVTHILAKS